MPTADPIARPFTFDASNGVRQTGIVLSPPNQTADDVENIIFCLPDDGARAVSFPRNPLQPNEQCVVINAPGSADDAFFVALRELYESRQSEKNYWIGHGKGADNIFRMFCNGTNRNPELINSFSGSGTTNISNCADNTSFKAILEHEASNGVYPIGGGFGSRGSRVGYVLSQADFTEQVAGSIGCNISDLEVSSGTVGGYPANITIFNDGCNGDGIVTHKEVYTGQGPISSYVLTVDETARAFAQIRAHAITVAPSLAPSQNPTGQFDTLAPTAAPSWTPTLPPSSPAPSVAPTAVPSEVPTGSPSSQAPSVRPTETPSGNPTAVPSKQPTASPSSQAPSVRPTETPSGNPTAVPSKQPTVSPSSQAPSVRPTGVPSKSPTTGSPESLAPSNNPTAVPSKQPTGSPSSQAPSGRPTETPSGEPTVSPSSLAPSLEPTAAFVNNLTGSPTTAFIAIFTSLAPSLAPSNNPPVITGSAAPTTEPAYDTTSAPTSNEVDLSSGGSDVNPVFIVAAAVGTVIFVVAVTLAVSEKARKTMHSLLGKQDGDGSNIIISCTNPTYDGDNAGGFRVGRGFVPPNLDSTGARLDTGTEQGEQVVPGSEEYTYEEPVPGSGEYDSADGPSARVYEVIPEAPSASQASGRSSDGARPDDGDPAEPYDVKSIEQVLRLSNRPQVNRPQAGGAAALPNDDYADPEDAYRQAGNVDDRFYATTAPQPSTRTAFDYRGHMPPGVGAAAQGQRVVYAGTVPSASDGLPCASDSYDGFGDGAAAGPGKPKPETPASTVEAYAQVSKLVAGDGKQPGRSSA